MSSLTRPQEGGNMRIAIVSSGLFLATHSLAMSAPQAGQVIWSDIRYGMTKDQVRALHPKNQKVDLGNGCVAWLAPGYDGKLVIEVKLGGSGDANCDFNVLASLRAKYGEPRTDDVDVVEPSQTLRLSRYVRLRQLGLKGDEPFDTVRKRTWFTGDTLITLEMNETLRSWSVLYQPAEIQKPALTDKL